MRETQQSICEWADATFGVPASEASIIERALAEAKELVTACTSEPRAATTQIGWEAADQPPIRQPACRGAASWLSSSSSLFPV